MTLPHVAQPCLGIDPFGLCHGSDTAAALAAFGEATEGLAAYRTETMPAVERALAADPGMVAAYALKGLLLLLAARAEALASARVVWRSLPHGAWTADEAALWEQFRAGGTAALKAAE